MTAPEPTRAYHSVNPFLFVRGAERLIAFLIAAFHAAEDERIARADGSIGHAELRIGDSIVMLSEASAEFAARPSALYAYVDDVDAAYARAIEAGATSVRVPTDQFYGNREAGVIDPAGNLWWIATLLEPRSSG